MNYRMIFRLCAASLLVESVFLLIPLIYSLAAGENPLPFLFTILILAALSLPTLLFIKPHSRALYSRDGWFCAGIIWLFISLGGSLPFFFGNLSPSFMDCFFETVSGFTTTGASIITDYSAVSSGLLLWRSLTNWLGGMGVLVLLLAIVPVSEVDMRSQFLLRAEAPGPSVSKLVPKMAQTAKLLYLLYIVMTVLTAIALLLAKMPLYEAVLHAWSIAGTGGFSPHSASIAQYQSTTVNVICMVSMFLFSINFMVLFHLCIRQFKAVLKDTEFLFHIGIFLTSTTAVCINLRNVYPTFGQALEHGAFQVISSVTSTGLVSSDFTAWPAFSKFVILALMTIGGCAGSTACGLKVVRLVILLKAVNREISRLIHPRLVRPVKLSGKVIDDSKVNSTFLFFVMYFFIIAFIALFIAADGHDAVTSLSAAFSTVNNVGPGFGTVGAQGSYSQFSILSKLVMSAGMLFGRLEIFPVLILLAPTTLKLHGQELFSVGKRLFKKAARN